MSEGPDSNRLEALIARLQYLHRTYGDLLVETRNMAGDLDYAQSPYTTKTHGGLLVVRITTDNGEWT